MVDDILALVELSGRARHAWLGHWSLDCARRAIHELVSGSAQHDPRFRAVLGELSAHYQGRAADLDLAERLAAALEHHHVRGRVAEAAALASASLDCALRRVEPGEVATMALQAMLPEQGDPTLAREFESRWQARRLLWRTGLMPRLPDMLVRLDLAEAAGALPRSGPALLRFDALRARIHADEDARLDLILEFGEALYLRELGLM